MFKHECQGYIFLNNFKMFQIIKVLNKFSEDINKQVDRNKQQRYQFYPGK